jgi:hypothetical protein
VLGRFIVDSVAYSGGLISQVTLRFEQSCETTGPAMHGYLRWSRSDATQPPAPGDPSQFTWSPPAGAVPATGNYLYVQSSSGDYIGQGKTFVDAPPAYAFAPSGTASFVTVHVSNPADSGDYWYLNLAARYNQTGLTTGYYPNVEPADGIYNPATGGMSFWGSGRGCNTSLGSFAVDQISYDAQGLASIQVRFVQNCEVNGTPLYGALRWTRP